ncbi:uncharacterized protein [Zea mays]|jgi:hypothetical protein|uniref:Uncharacterized protein n=1 Tax=Zea mays TaxID=4577 RepID=C0PDU8_MAIZE|nr:uncharacterized protein LOC103654573 [Zea mays]ACN33364.1 unknown [Zea mays]|eukprot:XP_008679640.1 uncharacterized protein LOC103654573 [Zea mays]
MSCAYLFLQCLDCIMMLLSVIFTFKIHLLCQFARLKLFIFTYYIYCGEFYCNGRMLYFIYLVGRSRSGLFSVVALMQCCFSGCLFFGTSGSLVDFHCMNELVFYIITTSFCAPAFGHIYVMANNLDFASLSSVREVTSFQLSPVLQRYTVHPFRVIQEVMLIMLSLIGNSVC